MISTKLTEERSAFSAKVTQTRGNLTGQVTQTRGTFEAFINTAKKIPDHLEIEGTWAGSCLCGHNVSENIAGLSFKCVYRNGSYIYVTPTYSPLVWSNDEGTQTVTFSYTENDITVTAELSATVVAILESIAISGTWENVQYAGSAVDTTGLSVIATFNNGRTEDVTLSASVSPSVWSDIVGTQTATFSYTYGGITATTTKDADVVSNWQGLPVGGIIFYIDSTADGIYTFHNANDEEVPAPTVGTDCTGWTYTVENATKDKYYVVYNQLYTLRRWCPHIDGSYVRVVTGYNATAIGTGKTNTAGIMSIDGGKYIQENSNGYPTIWYAINQMRTNTLGGCDDWYVGSKDEIEALRTSGILPSWFTNKNIWTSSEYSGSSSYRWYASWDYNNKYNSYNICGIRSF